MGAVRLWLRTTFRRHATATLALALVAGLAAGVIGAAVAAARRSASSIDRYHVANRVYDVSLGACPPGVDPSTLTAVQQFLDLCTNPDVAERFRQLVAKLPSVAATGVYGNGVAAVLDASSPNGWGRDVVVSFGLTPGAPLLFGHPIVVAGRLPHPEATDEVVLGESAARAGGIRAGDVLRLASWRQEDLDRAADGQLRPQTAPFDTRVVGIVRYAEDVQATGEGNISGTVLPNGMYAAAGWGRAHGVALAAYGAQVAVRLRGGTAAQGTLEQELARGADGWSTSPSTISDVDESALRRAIGLERQAVLVAAVIAAVAAVVLVGLLVLSELRRELHEAPQLTALGMTRGQVAMTGAVRAITIGLPAAVVAAAVLVLASPLGPVGVARRIEFSHPVRADGLVLVGLVVAVAALFAVAAPIAARRATSAPGTRSAPSGIGRGLLGAEVQAGLSFARGGPARVVSAVVCCAAVAGVTAAGLVASLDRVINEPARYGAWWTVAVGQYSEGSTLAVAAERIADDPDVAGAAGIYDMRSVTVDGVEVPFLAYETYVGQPAPVISDGRVPLQEFEIALGRATARHLHRGIGDTVTVAPRDGSDPGRTFTVVGIAVLDNPVASTRNAGDGAFVTPDVAKIIAESVPQSIAVRIDPRADRDAVVARLAKDFGGSMRLARPQADLQNLQRLRSVPWLLAALVVLLAFGTLTQALVSLMHRHRRDIAVLAAHGMTRWQLLGTGASAAAALVALGIVIGVPLGVIAGRLTWGVLADRISIPPSPVSPWLPVVLVPLVALAAANLVTAAAGRRLHRFSPSETLHSE